MAIVEHARCVHGELVHEADVHAPTTVEYADAHKSLEAADAHASHAHCDAWAHEIAGLPSPDAPALVGLIDWQPQPPSVRPADEHAPVPLLALAPKHAPPSS